MKKITLSFIIFSAAIFPAAAQSAASSFTAGGILVIYKPTQKQIINVSVYFRGRCKQLPCG